MNSFSLVSGALTQAPEQKAAKSGKPSVSKTIIVAVENGVDFSSAIALSETAHAELRLLGEGNNATIQGQLKLGTYVTSEGETRVGRTLFADHVLALRQLQRDRKTTGSFNASAADRSNRGADFD